jgi:hypothetical protein
MNLKLEIFMKYVCAITSVKSTYVFEPGSVIGYELCYEQAVVGSRTDEVNEFT